MNYGSAIACTATLGRVRQASIQRSESARGLTSCQAHLAPRAELPGHARTAHVTRASVRGLNEERGAKWAVDRRPHSSRSRLAEGFGGNKAATEECCRLSLFSRACVTDGEQRLGQRPAHAVRTLPARATKCGRSAPPTFCTSWQHVNLARRPPFAPLLTPQWAYSERGARRTRVTSSARLSQTCGFCPYAYLRRCHVGQRLHG